MKNVVITGAGGFIGNALVDELLSYDINVIAISSQNIHKNYKGKLCKTIQIPLERIEELPGIIDLPVDVFYHLAWKGMSGKELSSPETQLENCLFLIKCMRAAHTLGCKKFIGAGTISQFENEDNGLHIMQDKEKYYRSCKGLCERYGSELSRELGISFIWPIITSAYGPGGKNPERLIYNIIRTMLLQESLDMSEGKQIFDFVYIKDVARAYRLVGEKGESGKRYVIGSGDAKPLKKWLASIPVILNSKGKLNFGRRQFNGKYLDHKYFDISELRKDTGYSPHVSFETGIQLTAKEYVMPV
ncbi:MAG: NAD(P)-dependent oxidoreductase [Eubacterium sp.]|nr:NAD(P)-dependent oxidoreductase [Eubacterium sp.]